MKGYCNQGYSWGAEAWADDSFKGHDKEPHFCNFGFIGYWGTSEDGPRLHSDPSLLQESAVLVGVTIFFDLI